MSSLSPIASSVVEHLVCFKVKSDSRQEDIQAMIDGLKSLKSLSGVIMLNVGSAIEGIPGGASLYTWTHALFGRYETKQALDDYSDSKAHVDVVVNLVRPIIEDIAAIDWVSELNSAPSDEGARVFHAVMMKFKDGVEDAQVEKMVAGLKGHEGVIPGLRQLSVGPNFSPARSKGFTWGLIASFADKDALRSYATHPEHVDVMKSAVLPVVDSYSVIDFEVL